MPLFSSLPWLRREKQARSRESRVRQKKSLFQKEQPGDYSDQEKDFFAQGENEQEMRKTPEERTSDLFIAEKERQQGSIEREGFARMDVTELQNSFNRDGNLDNVNQSPEVKIAFLRNLAEQVQAKQKALSVSKNVSFEDVAALKKELDDLEDLQVRYGLEIDFDGGPDGGESATLNEEDDFELEIEDDEEAPLAA